VVAGTSEKQSLGFPKDQSLYNQRT